MATRGAIGVYTSDGPIPEQVNERPWRGVYHHWNASPGGLGNLLLRHVERAAGDIDGVARRLIDDAPGGWADLFKERRNDEPADPITWRDPDALGVEYVYVFDRPGRRLDAFAAGKRIGSATFDARGIATPRFLDLAPIELGDPPEMGRSSVPMTCSELRALLRDASPEPDDGFWTQNAFGAIGGKSSGLEWLACEEREDGLWVSFRWFAWTIEGDERSICNVIDAEALVVPNAARPDRERVAAFLSAFGRVAPAYVDSALFPFAAFAKNPLVRTLARTPARFDAILRAYFDRQG